MIQEPTGKTADFGLSTSDWKDLFQTWAEIKPLSGNERVVAQQSSPAVSHTLKIRRHPDKSVTSEQRVKYGSRIFDIAAVLGERGSGELELACVEELS
jgi:SPP1 family predicted phage head-tail adaptor